MLYIIPLFLFHPAVQEAKTLCLASKRLRRELVHSPDSSAASTHLKGRFDKFLPQAPGTLLEGSVAEEHSHGRGRESRGGGGDRFSAQPLAVRPTIPGTDGERGRRAVPKQASSSVVFDRQEALLKKGVPSGSSFMVFVLLIE